MRLIIELAAMALLMRYRGVDNRSIGFVLIGWFSLWLLLFLMSFARAVRAGKIDEEEG